MGRYYTLGTWKENCNPYDFLKMMLFGAMFVDWLEHVLLNLLWKLEVLKLFLLAFPLGWAGGIMGVLVFDSVWFGAFKRLLMCGCAGPSSSARGAFSSGELWGFSLGGFSCWEHRLSSCRDRLSCPEAQDLLRPEAEPLSPALVGEFLTPRSPGSPWLFSLAVQLRDLSFLSKD